MAYPRTNRLWKTKNQKNASELFESAEQFNKSSYEYFEWCDKHPLFRQEAVKSGSNTGSIINIPILRPYSLSGLCSYLGCSQSYYTKFKKKCSPDFLEVLEQIETIIETQQFEGATTGIFNSSIIARKLGLREQTDILSDGKPIFKIEVMDDKTKEELEKLREKLKK